MKSAIVNCLCPECGGAIDLSTDQFRCRGLCGKDWRSAWNLVVSGQKQRAIGSALGIREQ